MEGYLVSFSSRTGVFPGNYLTLNNKSNSQGIN